MSLIELPEIESLVIARITLKLVQVEGHTYNSAHWGLLRGYFRDCYVFPTKHGGILHSGLLRAGFLRAGCLRSAANTTTQFVVNLQNSNNIVIQTLPQTSSTTKTLHPERYTNPQNCST
jgi:hypothetical protein